jgi:hypothetical protein
MALLFTFYLGMTVLLQRQPIDDGYKKYLRWMLIGAALVGTIYVLAPALLSRDAFVYAGYGRVIVAHSANPYYTPLAAFPHDPLFTLDDWRTAIAAYGPLWLLVCAISTWISGSAVLPYVFFFRVLGLLAHLCNIALIATILSHMKRSPRIILTGTLLYALNPLVLLESSLGAHNDTAMVTCLLLGILLTLRAEQNAFQHTFPVLAPVIPFTAAVLIKFTAAPLLAFYVVLLSFHLLRADTSLPVKQRLRMILSRGIGVCLFASSLVLVAYTPLWLGHTVRDMLTSFAAPPSSRLAFGSILLALQKVVASQSHPNALLAILSLHNTWNIINLVSMLLLFIVCAAWLWYHPTTQTLMYSSLAILGVLLVVTPWFFPWYVIWLVGLAAPCFSDQTTRTGYALLAGAITFSASALFIYLFRNDPPIGGWVGAICLTTIGPPLVVFLLALARRQQSRKHLNI